MISIVDKRVKEQESLLQDFHRQWFVNIAMRRGCQYVQAKPYSGITLMPPPESDDTVRVIINKMLGIHQTRTAQITKDMPMPEVIPASGQEEDKDTARKGTKLLSWLWREERIEEKLLNGVSWSVDTGDSFIYVYWDPDKGPEIPTYQKHEGTITGKEPYQIDEEGYVLDEEGKRLEENITLGDVAVDVIPPFDIINDGVSTNIQDSKWIIVQQAMPLSEIRKRWPERGAKVRAENDLETRAFYQRKLMAMVGNEQSRFGNEAKSSEKMAVVKTMFEKPTDKYQKGLKLVVANSVLLESDSMPYAHKLYPIIKIPDIEVSGSFWDLATMETLIPLQKGYNRVWSQIIENGNKLGNVKVIMTKNDGMGRETYDDTGFEVLLVDPGTDIHQLQPANLPAHVVNQIQWYDKAFEDVSGQHEVTQAKVPAGISSGRAIMLLQERDDTRLSPTKSRFYKAIQEIAYMALMLYSEFQDEEREYQIIGSSAYDIDDFKITKNEIQSMKKDIRIETENIIASHKRLQQDEVLNMYKEGLLGDQNDPDVKKKVLQILEFGNVADLFDEINLDVSEARRENQQFINVEGLEEIDNPDYNPANPMPNEPAKVFSTPAFDFENHEMHIQTHNKLRKSPRYKQMTLQLRRGLDKHVKVHEMYLSGKIPNDANKPTPPMPPQGMSPPPPMVGAPEGAMPVAPETAVPPPPVPPMPVG